jgi:hypothetical protein
MGSECPNGHGWQPQVGIITKDGLGVKKASEVIAKRLGCGCVVGGDEYKEFISQSAQIDQEAAQKVFALHQDAQAKKSSLWKAITAKKEA